MGPGLRGATQVAPGVLEEWVSGRLEEAAAIIEGGSEVICPVFRFKNPHRDSRRATEDTTVADPRPPIPLILIVRGLMDCGKPARPAAELPEPQCRSPSTEPGRKRNGAPVGRRFECLAYAAISCRLCPSRARLPERQRGLQPPAPSRVRRRARPRQQARRRAFHRASSSCRP
jgi:hypothetical protein